LVFCPKVYVLFIWKIQIGERDDFGFHGSADLNLFYLFLRFLQQKSRFDLRTKTALED
jgi:hypothetical protein